MIWLVALGGALGSVCRFLVGPAIQRAFGFSFPFGTLFINIVGSFILGVVAEIAIEGGPLSPNGRAFIGIGFCGGFTTFSAFSLETVALFEGGQVGRASAYVMASVVLSVTAALLGLVAARQVLAR